MKSKNIIKDLTQQVNVDQDKNEAELLYPASDDIYSKFIKEGNIDPDDITQMKSPNESSLSGKSNEKDFTDNLTGIDLDVPGDELDNEMENTGSEDEENNYYSLGGDDHNDLDED